MAGVGRIASSSWHVGLALRGDGLEMLWREGKEEEVMSDMCSCFWFGWEETDVGVGLELEWEQGARWLRLQLVGIVVCAELEKGCVPSVEG